MKGSAELAKAAAAEGRFTPARKELGATAVSEGCERHPPSLDATRGRGAEEAELLEVLEVAVEMGGGPALIGAGEVPATVRSE